MENKYEGWLTSNNFAKRAVAIVGYNFVGVLIIYACIGIPLMIVAFAVKLGMNM